MRIYNQLPFQLRTIDDLSNFENKLKTYFSKKEYDMEDLIVRYV